jgi:hypothetical protein
MGKIFLSEQIMPYQQYSGRKILLNLNIINIKKSTGITDILSVIPVQI